MPPFGAATKFESLSCAIYLTQAAKSTHPLRWSFSMIPQEITDGLPGLRPAINSDAVPWSSGRFSDRKPHGKDVNFTPT
jgi:hypothetical protein